MRAYRVVDIMAALITLSSTWRAASTPAVAPTLVLVHGLDSSRFTWNPFLSYCDICSWNTIALDLRGHGESRLGDAATFTAEAVAADAVESTRVAILVIVMSRSRWRSRVPLPRS